MGAIKNEMDTLEAKRKLAQATLLTHFQHMHNKLELGGVRLDSLKATILCVPREPFESLQHGNTLSLKGMREQ